MKPTSFKMTNIVGLENTYSKYVFLVSQCLKCLNKGPSTHGEEFVDEVSTKSQRIVDEGFLFAGEVFLRRDFVDEELLI